MKKINSIEEFIEGNQWRTELDKLRQLILTTELKEEIKWGAPIYTINGKNVLGLGGFKSYFGIWFHQGALLKDDAKLLISAQEGVTKALRQMRFNSIEEIDEKTIINYIHEAIENQKAGKEVKKSPPKILVIPSELETILKENTALNKMFGSLTPYKQREYADHIGGAKREETRLNRLDKALPMILAGKGLHDKYKNC